ncbi:MAG TPA: hypothetical protein VNQ97_00430 [Burkholderiaceae bacterium]|nr:hypothetical protein [Burkholderiaceae bacterium]
MTGRQTIASSKDRRPTGRVPARQAGQALVEGCIVLALFLLLWFALSWLAGLQDIGLAAQHAGRQLAFKHARGSQDDVHAAARRHFLSGPAHRWSSIDGSTILDTSLEASRVHIDIGPDLEEQAQPGGAAPHAAALRDGWALNDTGIVTARVSVATLASPAMSGRVSGHVHSNASGASLTLRRHTSVLANAGHAEDDGAVQKRVAGSGPGWGDAAHVSYSLAQRISDRMAAVDSAWKRPLPRTDWLEAWAGAVPQPHLVSHDGGLHEH